MKESNSTEEYPVLMAGLQGGNYYFKCTVEAVSMKLHQVQPYQLSILNDGGGWFEQLYWHTAISSKTQFTCILLMHGMMCRTSVLFHSCNGKSKIVNWSITG